MKEYIDIIFPTLSIELKGIIGLIIALLTVVSLLLFIIGKIKPGINLSELRARTKSWWAMAAIFIGAIFISYKISYFFLAFLSFVAFRELYSTLGFRKSDRWAIFAGLLAVPVQYYLAYIGWYGSFIIFIPVIMFLLLPLPMVLKGETNGITRSMAQLHWILMLSVFGISHLAYLLSLPDLPGFETGGRGLLMFLVVLTELNDVMQFTWGKLLGKHKEKLKPGIAHLLSERPGLKYVPVYLTGMGHSLPKGEVLLLPYKSTVNYGLATLPRGNSIEEIIEQISLDFNQLMEEHQPPGD